MTIAGWQARFERIGQWLQRVDFGDPNKNRVALYLQATSLLTVLACGIIALNYLLVGETLVVAFLVIACALYATIFILIRRRLLAPATLLFLGALPGILTLGLLIKNGMRGAGALLFPVIIIFASLILPRRHFALYTLALLACVGLIIYADHAGLILTITLDPPDATLFFTFAIILIFTAIVIRVLTEDLKTSLERAVGNERILETQTRLIEASESRWRTLVTNSPVVIAQCDREGRISFINLPHINPKSLAEEISVYTFVAEKYHDIVRNGLQLMFDTGQPAQYEMEGMSPSGDMVWYTVTAGPVIENGEVTSAVIIATDISKQKQAEAQIRALNAALDQRVRERTEELESAYAELELFSYTVSHNLRTPARAMTGFSEMMLRENKNQLDADGQERLRRISRNAITMGMMIDDLLEFLQLGRESIKKRKISPATIARHALGKLPAYLSNQHIRFTIGDMPACHADPDMLTLVYTHLLDNAIKFSRRNPAAEVQVGSFEREGEIILFVRDNGIGFDMQYVGKLFGMFAQLHRPGEFEGNGVGLATVQRIVRRHGGRVWAEGKPSLGATFYFTLPG